jgi:DtxR family transcriptional regulator, Mn-dependent transcriptional regulator
MTDPHLTPGSKSKAVEDFLKAVYSLQQSNERVSTNTLAEVLTISAPSVTDMAQRMVKDGLVDYQKYRGVVLTSVGEEIALKIIRRHRLIELYLVTELGYELHEVHHEAENLEHAVSDRFIEAIAQKLGDPNFDPHGDPIPAADGTLLTRQLSPLTDWPTGLPAVVRRLFTDSPDMLRHILDRGFKLEALVEVLARDPFDGPIVALVNDEERVIGHNVAACILVDAVD